MKTLIYGAGPIGQWIALRLHQASKEVKLLARGEKLAKLKSEGLTLVDGHTGEKLSASVDLVEHISPGDAYDLVIVPMRKSSRLAVCEDLASHSKLENILFLGNDVSGFNTYFEVLPREKVLLGFPSTGGGVEGEELVFVDRDKPRGKMRPIHIGEPGGKVSQRMKRIHAFFSSAGVPVSLEEDMDGWLKYHFAFVAPMAAAILKSGKDVRAVATNKPLLRQFVLACREAGDVLQEAGYPKRQPAIFNLFYWTPLLLVPTVFKKLFNSRFAEVAIGLHLNEIGSEFAEMVDEFSLLQAKVGIETPNLCDLLLQLRLGSSEK